MTAEEKRGLLRRLYSTLIGRNIYSQNVTKRQCVYTQYKDKKYYSDCSSSIDATYRKAKLGAVGGNTVAIYNNKSCKTVSCGIAKGKPVDLKKLAIGDLLLFAGTEASRSAAEYVGHVEMVHTIKKDAKGKITSIKLCGHGSGTPSYKDLMAYCKARYSRKSSTKRGNCGLIKVVRKVQDD